MNVYWQERSETVFIYPFIAERLICFFTILTVTPEVFGTWQEEQSGIARFPPSQQLAEEKQDKQNFPSVSIALVEEKWGMQNSPTSHCADPALVTSDVFCFQYWLPSQGCCLLLEEGMTHSCSLDLRFQFPLIVLLFLLKTHSAKLEEQPRRTESSF